MPSTVATLARSGRTMAAQTSENRAMPARAAATSHGVLPPARSRLAAISGMNPPTIAETW